ncbi:MAG: hypothetical protein DMG97_22400 [Acidobacteria bacterium]|nr:MAG: hypothetical protein DMG97_22400 [Acidobacteriota bacterium]
MARIRRYRTAHLRGAQFLKVVRAERWISGGSFAYLSASHNGYARLLDPVIHRRSVFSSSGRFLVDPGAIEGNDEHQVENSWHVCCRGKSYRSGKWTTRVAQSYPENANSRDGILSCVAHLADLSMAEGDCCSSAPRSRNCSAGPRCCMTMHIRPVRRRPPAYPC